MRPRLRSLALGAAGGVGSLALWGLLGGSSGFTKAPEPIGPRPAVGSAPPQEASPPSSGQSIADLRRALREQDAELETLRELLEEAADVLVGLDDEVASLRGQLARLRERSSSEAGAAAGAGSGLLEETQPLFDAPALLQAGVNPARAQWLRRRFEQAELERLELRHRAARERWLPRRLRAESRRLTQSLKQELGPESYDLMLYATGRHNRVVVRHVLSASEAETAGVSPGDVILGYADQRVFSPRELQELTTRGKSGEDVSMDVLRGGQLLHLRMRRGPIGVRLAARRVLPEMGP